MPEKQEMSEEHKTPEEQNNPDINRENAPFLVNNAEEPREKSTRSWWIKTILLLLLVALSIAMLFTLGNELDKDAPQLSLSELLQVVNYPRLALLLAIVLLYIVVESGKYSYMLKLNTGKFRFLTSVKTMFLGKYYDGVTPFSTGGQPFQIYYLHKKKDIPGGAATAIPVMRYAVSILILSVVSVILLALSPKFLEATTITVTVLILSWISLAINIVFPIMVVLFSVFPNTSKRIVVRFVNLLAKMHVVKQKYKTTEKFVRGLTEYSSALKRIGREFYKYIPLLFLCMIEVSLFLTIPFFAVIAIGNVEPTFELAMQIACLVVITRYTALLIPTPGNTGGTEAASSLVFSTVAGIASVVGWVILTWRFLTYYVYILTGIGINIFEIIRSAVRSKRRKNRQNNGL